MADKLKVYKQTEITYQLSLTKYLIFWFISACRRAYVCLESIEILQVHEMLVPAQNFFT